MKFELRQRVRHVHSGWSGPIVGLRLGTDEHLVVMVRPEYPRPKEVWVPGPNRFMPTPDDWKGWTPIEVDAEELEIV